MEGVRASLGFVLGVAIVGCGGGSAGDVEPTQKPPPGEVPTACGAREAPLEGGGCGKVGPTEAPCAPGEALLDSGECRPAGVPPDACGKGFVPDGDGGCNPVLPATPCVKGKMAIPGETACREVAPCAAGTWGDIPVDASTQFVDGSYAGMDSDGSPAKPWTKINDAVAAAMPGAIVAIAEGSYPESVVVKDKAVRLWGRCPGMVEILGSGYGVQVLPGAAGTEIRDLAVTLGGQGWAGIGVGEVKDVLIDRVWVHDINGPRGLDLTDDDPSGSTSVKITRSLVELTQVIAVMVWSADAVLEETVIRDSGGSLGRGMVVAMNPIAQVPASAIVRSCIFERSLESGILVGSADLTLEDSLVSATAGTADGLEGRGVVAFAGSVGGAPQVTIRSSLVADSGLAGISLLGAQATIETTVVRDTRGRKSDGNYGSGIAIASDVDFPATLSLASSLIERSTSIGLDIWGSDATVDGTIVRATAPRVSDGYLGWGVSIVDDSELDKPSSATLTDCRVEQSFATGVLVGGSTVAIEGTVVRDTHPQQADQLMGFGIWSDESEDGDRGNLTVRQSLIQNSSSAGIIVVASDALIEDVTVEDTKEEAAEHLLGIGISFERRSHRAAGTIRSSLVRASQGIGVYSSDADLVMETSVVEDTGTQPSDGGFGDGVLILSDGSSSTFTAHRNVITQSARAGLSSFGSPVKLGLSVLDCNAIHLDGEETSKFDYSFEDLGQNWCGCGATADVCKVLSSSLAAPGGLPPAPGTSDPVPDQNL